MRPIAFILGAVVVIGLLIFFLTRPQPGPVAVDVGTDDEDGFVCAQDVRECTDGTFVSRIPPTCDFAACTSETATSTSGTRVTARGSINQAVSAFGTTVVPLTVLEDSRCPQAVQCIQAGTVRVNARVTGTSTPVTREFRLGETVRLGDVRVTLSSVTPLKTATSTIQNSEYRFTFTVEK